MRFRLSAIPFIWITPATTSQQNTDEMAPTPSFGMQSAGGAAAYLDPRSRRRSEVSLVDLATAPAAHPQRRSSPPRPASSTGPGSEQAVADAIDVISIAADALRTTPSAVLPPSPTDLAYERLKAYRDENLPLRWPDDARQLELDEIWLRHYAPYLAARKATYGDAYVEFGGAMKLPVAEGLLSASFEGVKGGVSSLTRGPTGVTVATWLSSADSSPFKNERELTRTGDYATIAGAIAGVSSFTTEKSVLAGADAAAIKANVPIMKSVGEAILNPPPCTSAEQVIVEVQGLKYRELYEPGTVHARPIGPPGLASAGPALKTVPELEGETRQQNSAVGWRQTLANNESLVKPVFAGAFQVGRRAAMPEQALDMALAVWGYSMPFSMTAGALTKFGTEALKVASYFGQQEVDNFVGGKQRLNLFVLKGRGRDPKERLAHWGDYPRLPAAVYGAVTAAPGLLLESFRHPRQLFWDFLWRHEVANIAGAVFGPAAAKSWVDSLRGKPVDPKASLKSGLFYLQQFASSAINEQAYKAFQEGFRQVQVNPVEKLYQRLQMAYADRLRRDPEQWAGLESAGDAQSLRTSVAVVPSAPPSLRIATPEVRPFDVLAAYRALPDHPGDGDAAEATGAYLDGVAERGRIEDPHFDDRPIVLVIAEIQLNRASVAVTRRGVQWLRSLSRQYANPALLLEGDIESHTNDWRTALTIAKENKTGIAEYLDAQDRTARGSLYSPLSDRGRSTLAGFAAHQLTADDHALSMGPLEPQTDFYVEADDDSDDIAWHAARDAHRTAGATAALQTHGDCVVVMGMANALKLRDELQAIAIGEVDSIADSPPTLRPRVVIVCPIPLSDPDFADSIGDDPEVESRIGKLISGTDPDIFAFRTVDANFTDDDLAQLIRTE